MLLFTRVLSDCTCVWLAFTRVFKWYRLKPMQFQAGYVIQMLKPTHTATTNEQNHYRKCQKLLKPRRLSTKDELKEAGTHTSILAPGRPSDKDNGLHAPAQLRLARTHGTQRKQRRYKIDLPVTGDRTSRTNSHKPPISEFTFMNSDFRFHLSVFSSLCVC